MTRTRVHRAAAAACALTVLLLAPGCAPTPPEAVVSAPPPPLPAAPAADEALFARIQALNARAEDPELSEADAARLSAEMASALDEFLGAPPEARASLRLQGAVERMSDLAFQLELDANAAPEAPTAEAETPRDVLLGITTFLPQSDLQKTLESVRQAQASVAVGIPIPVDNPAVLTYVNLYQTKYRNWFAATLERGAPYVPAFRRIFRDEGVPQDLVYLAIVESGFKPGAVSRARAVGMWQFIAGTARRCGLTVDFWEDQRLDPEASARASARYLKELYDLFGDWQLALAAYNCGEFKIQRTLKRTQKETFWDLKTTRYLRRETREYVPAILAAILIASNPEAYGLAPPAAPPPEPAAAVPLDQPADLRLLARCADLPVEALQAINPSLRRLITPPRPFSLRVPADRLESFQAKLAAVPAEEKVAVALHKVAPGESLRSVAARYQVPPNLVRAVNRLPSGRVRPGQELVIPIGPAASDPSLYAEDRTGGRRPQKIYKVRKGDTLASIAARTGLPVDTLRETNNLQGDALRPGQRLVLASGGGHPPSRRHSAPAGAKVHHVQQGDTLYQLAQRYGTSVDRICRLNRISPGKTLHLGDSLLIPE